MRRDNIFKLFQNFSENAEITRVLVWRKGKEKSLLTTLEYRKKHTQFKIRKSVFPGFQRY